MKLPSIDLIQSLREQYPKSSRITLNHMNDPYHPVAPGTTGTLQYIDDAGTFHMLWDNGRTLGLIYGGRQLYHYGTRTSRSAGQAVCTNSDCRREKDAGFISSV